MKITKIPKLYHGNDVEFFGEPVLNPFGELKAFGMAYSVGWDIPTLWAVDQSDSCWMNGAHGGQLHPCSFGALMNELENEQDRNRVRFLMGMKPLVSSWIKMALSAGWTPPSDFDRDQYEW